MKNDSLMLPLLFTAMIAVAVVQGAEKATVSQQTGKNWTQMSPYALVDSLYCPGQKKNRRKDLPPDGSQPWMKMPTKDFLPFIDKYGQFRWRDWPGKTKCDEDLKRAAEEEAKDLAVNPGPPDWNKYGGWTKGPQLKATGRFRTEKIDGKWWLVDPEGRLFWSFGVMRVSASCAMTPLNGDIGATRTGRVIPDRDCFFEWLPPEPGRAVSPLTAVSDPFTKFWTTRDELLWPFYEARGETRVFDFSAANLYRKYGEDYYAKFVDLSHRRLRSWCVNTISSSSDKRICSARRTPYCDRVERLSRFIEGSRGHWWKFRDPWDPSFRTSVLEALAKRDGQGHDPMCLGFSIDNEVNWGNSPSQLAEWTLRSPADQPAKAALVDFMKKRYGEIAKHNTAWKTSYADWDDLLRTVKLPGGAAKKDLVAFTAVIVEEYFKRTRAAVKEYDPQLLYLACRFCTTAPSWVIGPCAKYSDVVTYNIYSPGVKNLRLPEGVEDKPILITEFHFGAPDRGPFGASNWPTASQKERAESLQAYVRSALANPQIVGAHWHQFSDEATTGRFDGEYFQVGWTDICDRPYPETIKAVRESGGHMYETRFSTAAVAVVTQGAEKWPETPPPTGKSVTWERLNKLDPGLKQIGRLAVCEAKDLKSSAWSIGCETLDRDYADWDAMKQNIGPLGAKHGRLFSGWAKTEKKKGVYDFAWLDRPVREMAAMGVKPWICLSYGNPIYGSDFRLNMKVREVTGNPEAFAAWLRYCTACVERYKDVVDEWEVWNEPFGQGKDYAEMFYRTARAIRAVQPNAKIYCTAVSLPNDYKCVLERLKKENALDLASYFIYHPYDPNPDITRAKYVQPLRKLVKSYSGAFDIMQGESGCPSQLEYAHAMPDIEWTEYSQAKWAVRRAVGDAARAIPSGYFSLVDNNYGTMLQSFGLVRCNGQKKAVYRRPSYHALRNVFCFLTSEAHPVSVADRDVWFEMVQRFDPRDTSTRKMSAARFTRYGSTVRFFWFSDSRPSDTLGFDRATVWMHPEGLSHPVWVEMITGRVFEIPEKDIRREKDRLLITVPMWDSPVMIAPRGAVPLHYDWKKASPYTIIDSIYRPGQPGNWMKALPPDGTAPWMKMKTEDFLPCFDKYGQFRWRDWPGKTKSDADLARAAEEEAKDLAANPGPKTWDKYGGWAAGPQLEATGRFRTEKVNGKWWFVDPEGHLFWSFGVMRASASCGMTPMNGDMGKPHRGIPIADRDCLFTDLPPPPGACNATPFSKFWTTHDELLMPYYEARNETRIYDLSSANLYRKYGGADYYEKFADIIHRRMRSWCMNTLSSSSDIPICLMDRTPYVERIERKSRPIEGSYGEWFKFPDPWDPTFRTGILKELDKRKAQAKDPWCIGFFVDNEINWGDSPSQLAEWTLQSPSDQLAKKALVDFMRKKYGDIAKLNTVWGTRYADWDDLLHSTFLPGQKASGDLTAFSREIEENYFRGVRAAVKEYDPKLLYLGCRFCGFWGSRRESVRAACARHCDVVSYNYYRESPKSLEKALAGYDRPVLIPEFHFGANDRGLFGTGVRAAKDMAEKADKAERYVRDALSIPQVVGCHWHQFSDEATSGRFDGEYISVGLTDICDTPYPEMVKALREVGGNLYETRNGMTTSIP